MYEIREHMPGITVVQKFNQGLSRRLGVLSGGGPFWVPFWASKKVQKRGRSRNGIVKSEITQIFKMNQSLRYEFPVD